MNTPTKTYPPASRLAYMVNQAADDEEGQDAQELRYLADALLSITDPADATSIDLIIEALDVVSIYD